MNGERGAGGGKKRGTATRARAFEKGGAATKGIGRGGGGEARKEGRPERSLATTKKGEKGGSGLTGSE